MVPPPPPSPPKTRKQLSAGALHRLFAAELQKMHDRLVEAPLGVADALVVSFGLVALR